MVQAQSRGGSRGDPASLGGTSSTDLNVVYDSGGGPPAKRKTLLSNAVLGTMIFILTEIMLFGGLVSAFLIGKSMASFGWPPPGQPRLPIENTAFNTLALLLSGVALFVAHRRITDAPATAKSPLWAAILLGTFFTVSQGYEWVGLIAEGLTLTSSVHGAFFYLIVGAHALHVMVALGFLISCGLQVNQGAVELNRFHATEAFWYFVVGIWPVLYGLVYLS